VNLCCRYEKILNKEIRIGILSHKEHPPEVLHILPGTFCISTAQEKNVIREEEILRDLEDGGSISGQSLNRP
jgi:hypothetical protein